MVACQPGPACRISNWRRVVSGIGTTLQTVSGRRGWPMSEVGPIADIAVLGQPDNQDLSEQADSYDRLLEGMASLVVADAPAQGTELLTFGDSSGREPCARRRPFAGALAQGTPAQRPRDAPRRLAGVRAGGVLRLWYVGVAYRRRKRRRDWRCLRLAIEPGNPGQSLDPVGARHRRAGASCTKMFPA